MWYDELESQKQYKRTLVTYQKVINQMYGMKYWDDNHVDCDNFILDIFKHLLAKRCYKTFLSVVTSGSRCLRDLQYHLKVDSIFRSSY